MSSLLLVCLSTEVTEARTWIQKDTHNHECLYLLRAVVCVISSPALCWSSPEVSGGASWQLTAGTRGIHTSHHTVWSVNSTWSLKQWSGSIHELKPVQIQFPSYTSGKDPGSENWGSFPSNIQTEGDMVEILLLFAATLWGDRGERDRIFWKCTVIKTKGNKLVAVYAKKK